MKVSVDDSRCHGHQMCAIAAPDVFGSDEYGNAVVLLDPVPVDLEPSVRRAEANCPERAITLHESAISLPKTEG
jgi:ferredoxin